MLTADTLEELNSLFFSRCTPLLFAAENQSPQALGSAVYLEKDDQHYLISAAHNAKLIDEYGALYLTVRRLSDPEYSAIARFDNLQYVISDDKGCEQVDLLFAHFLKEESARFPTFSAFVTEDDFGNEQDAEFFYVVGFAASRNKRPKRLLTGQTIKKYSSTSLHCDRHPNERKILDESNYNHKNHVVVSYNRRSYSRDGKKIFAPDPHGISGGALFGIKKEGNGYRGFLCGFAMEYIERKGAIVCTRLPILLEGLYPHRFDNDSTGPSSQRRSDELTRIGASDLLIRQSKSEKAATVLLPKGVGIYLERFDLTLGDLIWLAQRALDDPNITPDSFGLGKYFFFVNSSTSCLIDDTLDFKRQLSTIGIYDKNVIELRLCNPERRPDGSVLNPMRGVKFFAK